MTYIEVNDIKLNFEIEGQGFPVLLIHGFSDDLHYWDHVAYKLKNYFTVIRVDLRGHGKTEIGDIQIDNHLLAKDCIELLKKLYIDKCHIIGFSLGGSIAIDIAINKPKLVKSLILLSTFASNNQYIVAKFKELNKALKKSYETFYDIILPYVLPKNIIEDNIEKLEKVKKTKAKHENTDDLRRVLYGAVLYDELNQVNKIKCNTLIIASKEDTLVPFENSVEMGERINKSEVILVDYVKHNLLIKENFENMMEIILKFLRNN